MTKTVVTSAMRGWDDLKFPASNLRPGNTPPDSEVFTGGIRMLAFDAAQAEEVYGVAQFPHGWEVDSMIVPHVHWCPSDAGAGSVNWGFEYTWADQEGTFGASTTLYISDAADGVAKKHQYASFGEIISPVTGLSSCMAFRIFRDATGAGGTDDYGSDAFLLEFDIHIVTDTSGSSQELVK